MLYLCYSRLGKADLIFWLLFSCFNKITNPLDTSKWTIRAAFGTDNRRNAVHGSDSIFSAAREINFFFGENLKLEKYCAV